MICGHIALARLKKTDVSPQKRAKISLALGYIVLVVMILEFVLLATNRKDRKA